MDFRHYTDTAASLAEALVNVYAEAEDDGRPVRTEEVAEVLAAHQVDGAVTGKDVERLGELAWRLYDVFAAPDVHAAVAAVNDLLHNTSASPWVTEHDGLAPHLHFARPQADLVERTAASTAVGLAVVLCDHGRDRLGVCASTTCRDVFIDTSRNAQRRYCSEGCANVSNVRAHRARKRAEDG